jgi:hypothetical protein
MIYESARNFSNASAPEVAPQHQERACDAPPRYARERWQDEKEIVVNIEKAGEEKLGPHIHGGLGKADENGGGDARPAITNKDRRGSAKNDFDPAEEQRQEQEEGEFDGAGPVHAASLGRINRSHHGPHIFEGAAARERRGTLEFLQLNAGWLDRAGYRCGSGRASRRGEHGARRDDEATQFIAKARVTFQGPLNLAHNQVEAGFRQHDPANGGLTLH